MKAPAHMLLKRKPVGRKRAPDRRIIARGIARLADGTFRRVEFHATKGWRVYRLAA